MSELWVWGARVGMTPSSWSGAALRLAGFVNLPSPRFAPALPHRSVARRQVAILLCLLDVAAGMSYLNSMGIVHGGEQQ